MGLLGVENLTTIFETNRDSFSYLTRGPGAGCRWFGFAGLTLSASFPEILWLRSLKVDVLASGSSFKAGKRRSSRDSYTHSFDKHVSRGSQFARHGCRHRAMVVNKTEKISVPLGAS